MTSVQRVFLIVVAVVVAAYLESSLCDFKIAHQGHYRDKTLALGLESSRVVQMPGGDPTDLIQVPVYYGFLREDDVSIGEATAFGIAVPVLLLTGAGYLALGWRRAIRQDRGHCLRCGYDVQYAYHTRCPECGWQGGSAPRAVR